MVESPPSYISTDIWTRALRLAVTVAAVNAVAVAVGQRCVGAFLTIASSRTDGEFRIGDAHRFVLSHSCQSVRAIACVDGLGAVNTLLQSWRCSQRCQRLRWLASSEPERLRGSSSTQHLVKDEGKGQGWTG